MKATENFTKVINDYLIVLAEKDAIFAQTLQKPNKNTADCITYILNTVQQSGCNGFEDDEIFQMAIHYYDEDNLAIGNPINAKVVINQTVVLTPEEIQEAKQKAMDSAVRIAQEKMLHKPTKEQNKIQEPSLFDAL